MSVSSSRAPVFRAGSRQSRNQRESRKGSKHRKRMLANVSRMTVIRQHDPSRVMKRIKRIKKAVRMGKQCGLDSLSRQI